MGNRYLFLCRAMISAGLGLLWTLSLTSVPARADMAKTIERVRPSIVGVGTYKLTRHPAVQFLGTGFVVGDGRHVITNAHVIPPFLDIEKRESITILTGRGSITQAREAEPVAQDADHDLVLLSMKGEPLPALIIGAAAIVREGQTYAFTGFPIGAVLGLYPVTHRAMISAVTPIAIPMRSSRNLDVKVLNRLRKPFEVFQLDATAYPGNSGSPLYHPATGQVVGVINMVFVKDTKESALDAPSGISYAIPAIYVKTLLERSGVKHK